MAIGTGGTFAADAAKIGMTTGDIRTLIDTLQFKGVKGYVPYEFKGTKYQVQYETSGGDTTLLSIKSL